MNKLSLNFKYTALQILYWAEASIVFVYVGFYLQAAGMSNGSVGVTIACANILSFALSNAFAELIDRKNKLTSFTASVFLLGLKILLSCSLAVLKDRNALPVAILYMFLIVFNLMSSIVYNKLYVDIEKSGNTVNFSRARGMGSLSFAVASAILGGLTLKFSVFVIPYLCAGVCLLQLAVLFITGNIRDTVSDEAYGTQDRSKGLAAFLRDDPGLCLLALGIAFIFAANNTVNNFYYVVIENAGGNSASIGYVNFVLAALELVVMLIYGRMKNRKYPLLLAVSLMFFPLKFAALAMSKTVTAIYFANILHALSFGLYTPVVVDFIRKTVAYSDSGKGQSLVGSAASLGTFVSTLAFGYMFDTYSPKTCLLVLALIAALGVPFGIAGIKRMSGKEPEQY